MAIYCIGDLHGRYDLFCMLLDKINFDPKQDKLYLLGDVIDWNYGGIKIIDYIMENSDACTLIIGNHEEHFLYMSKAYDSVMFNSAVKEAMKAVADLYSSNLFDPIINTFVNRFDKRTSESFYKHAVIRKWLKEGNPCVRKNCLTLWFLLLFRLILIKINFQKLNGYCQTSVVNSKRKLLFKNY